MKKPHPFQDMYQKRVQMTLSIVVITLFTLGLFGTLGYLLDAYFQTKPILLFVFVFLSFPLNQYLLYKRAKQLTNPKRRALR